MIKVKQPAGGLTAFLRRVGSDVEKAADKALSRTAHLVREELIAEMGRVFDRPTKFTLGAVAVHGPRVWIKDRSSVGKGTPASRYLAAQIDGGERRDKRAETLLRSIGILQLGEQAVPGAAARIDANGNMQRGQLVAMLSYFRSFSNWGNIGNRSTTGAKRRGKYRRHDWFVVWKQNRAASGQKMPPGIYLRDTRTGKERRGTSAAPVLIFVRRPVYRQRFDFFGVAQRVIDARLRGEIENAVRLGRSYSPRHGGGGG